jgi:dienelactone hydrolase
MNHSRISRRGFLITAAAGSWLAVSSRSAAATEVRDVPWLAEVQRRPAQLLDNPPALNPLLIDAKGQQITTLAAWKQHRETIRRRWQGFLGTLDVARETPPAMKILEEDRRDGVVRQLVQYDVEPGAPVQAYLLQPLKIEQPCPAAVVLHSTVRHTIRQPAGLEGNPAKAFGLKLARRGYVTLCPRCFLWTDDLSISYQEHVRRFHVRHPRCKGMARMLFDAKTAVDILAALPDVDADRLCAVGHSLGAKEVLYLAAFDERVRATVSSEGGIGTTFSNWDAPWYLSNEIGRDGFAHEHHELLALIAPRAFLLIGGNSADGDRSWPFIDAALPVYRLYGRTARLGLFNHRQGHSVPPEAERRIYEWLTTYCG